LICGVETPFPLEIVIGNVGCIDGELLVVRHGHIAFYKSLLLGSLFYFHCSRCLCIFVDAFHRSVFEIDWIHVFCASIPHLHLVPFFWCVIKLTRRYISRPTHFMFEYNAICASTRAFFSEGVLVLVVFRKSMCNAPARALKDVGKLEVFLQGARIDCFCPLLQGK